MMSSPSRTLADLAPTRRERYAAKFGDKVDAITAGMTQRGLPWGIKFDYGGNMSNTFLSHRLVEKAYEHGGEKSQRSLVEELFAGYFENQKDVGDHDYLASIGVKTGIFKDAEEAKTFLTSDELKSEVCADVRKAQSMGVSGVPFTVINNKYAVSGAQEPDAFLQIFRKIAQGQCPCKKGGGDEKSDKPRAAAPARPDEACAA